MDCNSSLSNNIYKTSGSFWTESELVVTDSEGYLRIYNIGKVGRDQEDMEEYDEM